MITIKAIMKTTISDTMIVTLCDTMNKGFYEKFNE